MNRNALPLPLLAVAGLTLTAMSTSAHAQNATPWPLGCPVPSTIANDSGAWLPYSSCTPRVTDAQGALVSLSLCSLTQFAMAPGGTWTTWWDQRDLLGQLVGPGIYYVDGKPFALGATPLGVAPLGMPRHGDTRHFALSAPGQANRPYLLGASFGSTFGTALGCGRTFPLDDDPLLSASLSTPQLFADFLGVLDDAGRSEAPAIVLPDLPALIGLQFFVAAATVDAQAPCGVGLVGAAVPVVVQ
ncbi:MAG: hypothetical protein R3F29_05840 [Planctomycetota bacterium]